MLEEEGESDVVDHWDPCRSCIYLVLRESAI